MSRFDKRSRGIFVDVVDFSKLEAEALAWRQESNPDCTKVSVFAICHEGVGFEVSDEEPLELEFHGNYLSRNEDGVVQANVTTFDFMPFGSYSITPEDLAEYPIKETVDLADFVRTFGARLENNFWLWFDELK
jgi:hypothetical protein